MDSFSSLDSTRGVVRLRVGTGAVSLHLRTDVMTTDLTGLGHDLPVRRIPLTR